MGIGEGDNGGDGKGTEEKNREKERATRVEPDHNITPMLWLKTPFSSFAIEVGVVFCPVIVHVVNF